MDKQILRAKLMKMGSNINSLSNEDVTTLLEALAIVESSLVLAKEQAELATLIKQKEDYESGKLIELIITKQTSIANRAIIS